LATATTAATTTPATATTGFRDRRGHRQGRKQADEEQDTLHGNFSFGRMKGCQKRHSYSTQTCLSTQNYQIVQIIQNARICSLDDRTSCPYAV
jgi:hypothetical protein